MKNREIVVCDNVVCRYSNDVGCFVGQLRWLETPIILYLRCESDDQIDHLLVKLAFDAIYREGELWTSKAIDFACKNFIPFFRFVSGSRDDLLDEVLPHHLIPSSIEFGIDGVLGMSFHSFWIGNKQSFLFVSGPISSGFCRLQENGEDIPILRD